MIAGHEGRRQVVLDGLGADEPAVRAVALGAAARLGILDYNLLTMALSDPALPVRRRALQLTARLYRWDPDAESRDSPTERGALAGLVVVLLGEDELAEEAAFCLGELGPTGDGVTTALEHQALHHHDSLCRESAVAALGSLGAGMATVLAALDDIATVRRRAVVALAAFDGPEIDAALERALHDRDWQVRQIAEDLLDP